MNYFIISCNDTMHNKKFISAYSIAKRRIYGYYWPIYKGTLCRSIIEDGDKFVIYIAGRGELSRNFIAFGDIRKVNKTEPFYEYDFSRKMTDMMLDLDNLCVFKRPVPIKSLVEELDLLKRHNNKLGLALAGGFKRITEQDYNLIVNSQASAPQTDSDF